MYEFSIERKMEAPAERLWTVLTDPGKLASGPFGINRLDGPIALGEKLRLWPSVALDRAFPLKVIQLQPDRSMVWKGGMPFGLFTGTRTFTLVPDGRGTQFRMREVYTGPLSGLILRSMPDLDPSFKQFADALAAAVE